MNPSNKKPHEDKERKRILDIFTECGGNSPGLPFVAPLKMPLQWSKVWRFGSGSRINVDEFLAVCTNFYLMNFYVSIYTIKMRVKIQYCPSLGSWLFLKLTS